MLLLLTALGIVYGDIGTSPLYASNRLLKLAEPCRPTQYWGSSR